MRALASVDLAAIERNIGLLAAAAPSAQLCAVVKGDGYGHGATEVAAAAIRAGATWLAVATAPEARELRAEGLELPVLVMGALTDAELKIAVAAKADVVAWSEYFLTGLSALGGGRVHIKLDTGMGRLGTRDVELASRLAARAEDEPSLDLVGLMTHFATADEIGDRFFSSQLEAFREWSDRIVATTPGVIRHAANSAALLRDDASHFDLVRPGVACYGLDPFGDDPAAQGLEPALRLESYVARAERSDAGQSSGYGRSFIAQAPTVIATVPIGYADGWRRGFSNNGEVLIGGRRFAVVGNVSMDNITVDLGADGGGVEPGDRVTLIGADGAERISSEELARLAGTINYEIVTAISARVERRYVGSEVEGR
ncbi:MAG: alanine racemase [Solirubrobacteraceae bacterium]|nr:alanine racemase [Solirubrobacteraceae bacterium]MDP4672263.1 alanine racemase [Solirubrobacteraceae bacterium]MDP4920648.1 alanine racemase [Solirubrobacteraceae bacterium]